MGGWELCRSGLPFINGARIFKLSAFPREDSAPRSGARCVQRTQRNTNRCTRPLCEVPIM
ncbi:unnamed protein product [Staurois parvus]|uniref:Uncharacterized protein n=1 Tax=Staurois parvus TaxID=386267 RepID=A0ABN9G6C6_9NEOB|nr:unnamed protein product [Staurois parvus]